MFKGKINALKTRVPLTWQKIRAILQLGRKAELRLFLPLKFEYFIIEKLNLQKISHTAVASNVARYNAFKSAVSLGNTLLWLFNLHNALLRLSIAFVVYITFRSSAENLNIGDITSKFSSQCFIAFG